MASYLMRPYLFKKSEAQVCSVKYIICPNGTIQNGLSLLTHLFVEMQFH